MEEIDAGCTPVWLRVNGGPNANVTVELMAIPLSGPNRLRDHGMPAYVAIDSAAIQTRGQSTGTLTTTWCQVPPASWFCFGNDRIEQPGRVIRILLMPGPGDRVDPNRRWIDISVFDMDNCTDLDGQLSNGGVVYQFTPDGGTCT